MDFSYRHILTIAAGQSGYSEPLGKEQAEVLHDSKRYIYDMGDHVRGGPLKGHVSEFRAWVRKIWIDDHNGDTRRLTGSYPSYRVD